MSISLLSIALHECKILFVLGVVNFFVLHTEILERTDSTSWLDQNLWKFITTFQVLNTLYYLIFSRQKSNVIIGAHLIAKIRDHDGKSRWLVRIFLYFSLPISIPFFARFETASGLTYDVWIRDGDESQVSVSKLKASFLLLDLKHL